MPSTTSSGARPAARPPRPSRSSSRRRRSIGAEPGDGLDAAEVRADRALGHDLHRADVAEGAYVGAAAELGGVRAGLEHAHDVAVLVAEEGDGAELLGLGLGGLVVADRARWRGSRGWRGPRCAAICVGGDRLVVAEVEAQPVGRDQRALLLDVVAEHLAQRPVQEVGRRCGCGGWRRGARRRWRRVASWPALDLALDDARPGGGAGPGSAVGRCRAPRPCRCRW